MHVIRVQKAAWLWPSLKVQKIHTKVNNDLIWDFEVENIPVQLHEHNTGYFGGLIKFTRC